MPPDRLVSAINTCKTHNAKEYAFPKAAARLNKTAVLLIDAKWGLDESGKTMKIFYSDIQKNPNIPFSIYITYPCNHGMMGARVRVTEDIAGFIEAAEIRRKKSYSEIFKQKQSEILSNRY